MKDLAIIAAISVENVIGIDGQLPWHYPEDLKRFKKLTTGHPIIMGRKTYESIGKPLPNRQNIIITRNKNYKAKGCFIAHSIEGALFEAKRGPYPFEMPFVIGGAEIYEQTMDYATKLYLTIIKRPYNGDTRFPIINDDEWDAKDCEQSEKHQEVEYIILKRHKRVHVLGASDALKFKPKVPTLAIRVIDPPSYKSGNNLSHDLQVSDLWTKIDPYVFDDINILEWPYNTWSLDKLKELKTNDRYLYSEEMAQQIVSNFVENWTDHSELLVHCTMGVSRSAGIAIALNEVFGLGEKKMKWHHCRYNTYVYKLTGKAALAHRYAELY